ncbi:MAG: response regulator transcription factor [Proteobacteria bacterium]|nr:response regulator transcription factor [Pseudomonadota bacterium]
MKILLVDDHPLLRGGMRFLLLSLDAELEMDEAGNCTQALGLLAGGSYDLVLLDLNMPGLNGLEALGAIREAAPNVPLVVLSGEGSPEVVRAAIEGGAMGFIPKSSTPEVLIQALQLVLAQGIYLPPLVLEAAHPPGSPGSTLPAKSATALPGITPRQMEVLQNVIRGRSNKAIARELDVSEGTVKAHISAIFLALGVHSRTEAVYAAANLGLRFSDKQ